MLSSIQLNTCMYKDLFKNISRLYLQLLYRCNFSCKHCFQGNNLNKNDQFSVAEAINTIKFFKNHSSVDCIVLNGGEPFLYRDLEEVIRYIKNQELTLEICTNGYRIEDKLDKFRAHIDKLRVSIDGLRETNDYIRKEGGFRCAINTIHHSINLDIPTSVTITINALNFIAPKRR